MELGNPPNIVVHYFLIKEMTCLGHWDDLSIVGALVYMITRWIRLMMNHDIGY